MSVKLQEKLSQQGLNLLASAVGVSGEDTVSRTLGVDVSSEPLDSLRQIESDSTEVLLNLASARQMQLTVDVSPNANFLSKNTAYILDLFIVGTTFVLVLAILFKAIPNDNKEILYTAFGSLMTLCLTVVQFHRGSSAHSAKKDDTIQQLSKGEIK